MAGSLSERSASTAPSTVQDGVNNDAGRAFQAASTFLSGVLAISASQALGAPLKLMDPKIYKDYMAWTKESFAILVTSITHWWSPTVVKVSGDESMQGQLYQMADGSLKCNFPHRMVLMANHQLYTDWLYLWWTAYTNKMHGHIYIIMKESLKQLPIIGWSGQLYNFIFLSRKWENDERRVRQALSHLCNPKDPMWLMIFPEGTNLSAETRAKSAAWAKKAGTTDMKHQLLPRSRGLQFCLQELKSSTNWLYDCTIAYEGVPKGSYGQDIYTLRSSFLEGKPPKAVNMHWRRFRISEIPLENADAFGRWLNNRWREKDYLLEYFSRYGHFPAGPAQDAIKRIQGKLPQEHTRCIATQIKGQGWEEFLGIFEPVTSLSELVSKVDLTEPLSPELLLSRVLQNGVTGNDSLKRILASAQQSEAAQQALQGLLAQSPIASPLQGKLLKSAQTSSGMLQKSRSLPSTKAAAARGTIAKRAVGTKTAHQQRAPLTRSNLQAATAADKKTAPSSRTL